MELIKMDIFMATGGQGQSFLQNYILHQKAFYEELGAQLSFTEDFITAEKASL